MVAQIPLVKLVGLGVKTLSKPVASRLKKAAIKHEDLRTVCAVIGDTVHRWSYVAVIRSAGHKAVEIKPLSESVAINHGADMIGDAFVFSVAAGVMVYEYARSKEKDAVKAGNLEARFQALEAECSQTKHELQQEAVKVEKLETRFKALESEHSQTKHDLQQLAALRKNLTPTNETTVAGEATSAPWWRLW